MAVFNIVINIVINTIIKIVVDIVINIVMITVSILVIDHIALIVIVTNLAFLKTISSRLQNLEDSSQPSYDVGRRSSPQQIRPTAFRVSHNTSTTTSSHSFQLASALHPK